MGLGDITSQPTCRFLRRCVPGQAEHVRFWPDYMAKKPHIETLAAAECMLAASRRLFAHPARGLQ